MITVPAAVTAPLPGRTEARRHGQLLPSDSIKNCAPEIQSKLRKVSKPPNFCSVHTWFKNHYPPIHTACASASRTLLRILHHAPVHIWGWNPSTIIVAHTHSV